MTIERQWLVEGYNEKYGENYPNYRSLLEFLYPKHKSTHTLERILGITHTSILIDLKHLKILVLPPGGDSECHKKRAPVHNAIIALPDIKNLTIKEIRQKINISSERYIRWVLRKDGIKYDKSRRG